MNRPQSSLHGPDPCGSGLSFSLNLDAFAKWKYLGTVGFARNYYKPDDRLYETREIVWDRPEDPSSTVLKVFGVFKQPKFALRDLLTNGNYSRNRRKAIQEWD